VGHPITNVKSNTYTALHRNPQTVNLRICAGVETPQPSVSQDGFVAEDAVEGGAADAELAGGAELVAAVQVEHRLHVAADDRIQREVLRAKEGLQLGLRVEAGGAGKIVGMQYPQLFNLLQGRSSVQLLRVPRKQS